MDVLQIIAYITGVAGFVAGLLGYYGKARGDSIIEYQSKTIASQKDYISTLESDKRVLEVDRDRWKLRAEEVSNIPAKVVELVKIALEDHKDGPEKDHNAKRKRR